MSSHGGREPAKNDSSQSSSSQKYLDYLEEMELKIRYMKNDIEFKKSQLNKKPEKSSTHSGQSQSQQHSGKSTRISGTSHVKKKLVSNHKMLANGDLTLPLSYQKHVTLRPELSDHVSYKDITSTNILLSSRRAMPSRDDEPKNERIVLPVSRAVQSKPLVSKTSVSSITCTSGSHQPVYVSPNKRTVVFSSKQFSNANTTSAKYVPYNSAEPSSSNCASHDNRTVLLSSKHQSVPTSNSLSVSNFAQTQTEYPVSSLSAQQLTQFQNINQLIIDNEAKAQISNNKPHDFHQHLHSTQSSSGFPEEQQNMNANCAGQNIQAVNTSASTIAFQPQQCNQTKLKYDVFRVKNRDASTKNSQNQAKTTAKSVSKYKMRRLSSSSTSRKPTPSQFVSQYKLKLLAPSSKEPHTSSSVAATNTSRTQVSPSVNSSPVAHFSGHVPGQSVSPWKLDKRLDRSLSLRSIGTSRSQNTSRGVISKFKLDKTSPGPSTDTGSSSGSLHTVGHAPRTLRQSTTSSLGSRTSHSILKTPLKVQIASKILTKCKWKRSPTSMKHSIQFMSPNHLHGHSKHRQGIISKHKLDKRGLNHNQEIHKNEETLYYSKASHSKHKIDRTQRNKASKDLSQVTVSRHKVDRRKFKTPMKGTDQHFQRRTNALNTRHKWVKGQWSGLRSYTPSKYRWKSLSLTPTSASPFSKIFCLKFSKISPEGKFQLKQKLHRLRMQGKNMGSRQGESSESELVSIGGILYNATSRKLSRATGGKEMNRPLASVSEPNVSRSRKDLFNIKSVRKQNMRLITVKGIPFKVDATGKKLIRKHLPGSSEDSGFKSRLSRVDVGGMTFVRTGNDSNDTLERRTGDGSRLAASRVVQRSLAIAAAKFKKDNRKNCVNKARHCMFYGRFGKCKRGDKCPFIHDPEKVAMCKRFLHGKCSQASCPFSHQASEHKMPVCLFYLRGGQCSRDGCPYLHVKVSPDAAVCLDFRNGYCAQGQNCKKLHSFVCPSFASVGRCAQGQKCRMNHPISRIATRSSGKAFQKDKSKAAHTQPSMRRSLSDSDISIRPSSMANTDHETTAESPLLTTEDSSKSPDALSGRMLQAQPSFISLVSSASSSTSSSSSSSSSSISCPAPIIEAVPSGAGGRLGGARGNEFRPEATKITPSFLNWKSNLTTNASNKC